MKQVTSSIFNEEVISANVPVLVDVYAEWCSPCRMLKPILEKLSSEYGNKAKFVILDGDTESQLITDYEVRALPTLLIFNSGKLVNKLVGLQGEKSIKEAMNQYVTQ